MARRREEEYSDEEMMEEEEELGELEMGDPNQKLLIIMTSSWGISFVVHLILIIILMFIYFVKPVKKKPPVVIARPAKIEQPFDETLPRSLHKTPKIEDQKQVEKPVKDVTPEKVESEKPKGTSLDNLSTKNLQSTATVDAYGVGGGAAGAYGYRNGHGKWSKHGGSRGSESAVQAALRWLKRHQFEGGYWKSAEFDGHCTRSPKCSNKFSGPSDTIRNEVDSGNIGRGMDGYDAGVTGLATLAFLGNGHTHKFGRFRRQVRRAIEWMKKVQVNDPSSQWHGSIGYIINGKKVEHPEWIYNHAICTMALCEAFAITRDFAIKDYAQRAVDFLVKCQNPGLGWRYDDKTPERAVKPGKNDTSVTGWAILALKAAKQSGHENGLRVPKETFHGAIEWFKKVTGSSGQAGYMTPGGPSSVLQGRQGTFGEVPTMTAVSILCRMFAGQRRSNAEIKKGSQIIMNSIPKWDPNNYKTVNMYYWYYGTYAMFQIGGKNWDCGKSYNSVEALQNKTCTCWNHAMQQALLLTQRQGEQGSCADGSWDPVGEWGIAGGRAYATAIGALTLEIYYRYERLKQ